MAEPLTLPLLQMQLDRLVPGQSLHLAAAEVERMFGFNDVAAGRVSNSRRVTIVRLRGPRPACSF